MSNAFNVGDATTTRDGRKARIICVDRKDSELPLLALITYAGGQEGVWAYTSAGRTYLSGHDLMPLPRLEDLAVDTPLLVRNHEDAEWANRHFAEVIDGKLLCWADGGTSWTAVGSSDTTAWQLWKLP